ncbi:MAG: ATP-binding protein [candidate division Zixibacteria bacterium]|nr:ATP-binding protein [candidate division Zixibacteria bacterium]
MDKPVISGNSIIVPSDSVYLAAVDDFLSTRLTEEGISQSIAADVAISVSEVVTNAIKHGNSDDINKKVTVKYELSQDEIIIYVKDEGNGFNPDAIPDPTDNNNLLKKVGRGIFIVRSLLDSIDFNFTNDGTEVILKRSIVRE